MGEGIFAARVCTAGRADVRGSTIAGAGDSGTAAAAGDSGTGDSGTGDSIATFFDDFLVTSFGMLSTSCANGTRMVTTLEKRI